MPLLYHLVPPTQTHKIEPVREVKLEAANEKAHRHHLTKTGAVEPKGDAISGRVPLYFNDDVGFGISWLPSDDHAKEASELAERDPEAFPD